MRVSVSRAEERIRNRLIQDGYGRYMQTQIGHKFHPLEDHVEGTRTDIEYSHPYTFWIYIDCEHIHQKPRQEQRDTHMNKAIERRKIPYKRYSYKYPLSKTREKEIVYDIESWLDSHGYTPTK